MTDYSKSSNKPEPKDDEAAEKPPEKRIEKVGDGVVVVRKKGIGRKTKDLIMSADLKGVAKYLLLERVIPNIRVMIYDAWVEGGNRVMFPGAPKRPMLDPRSAVGRAVFNYNGIASGGSSNRSGIPLRGDPRMAPTREIGPRASMMGRAQATRAGEQYLFMDKDFAVRVISTLREALDKYETPISIADLYEAMGQQSPNGHVDQKWGWTNLANVKLLQSSEGFILDFPPSEQIA